MRILWITLDALLPMDTAGRMGVLQRLENIYRDHEIYLYYFYSEDKDEEKSQKLVSMCKEVKGFKREKNKVKLLINYICYPFTVSTRISNALVADIDRCIENNHIQVVNIDFPQMGYSLLKSRKLENVKLVMNQHNVEWKRFDQISKSSSVSLFRRWISKIESIRLRRFEEKLYRKIKFDAFTFVTLEDKMSFEQWVKPKNTILEIIPGGGEYYGGLIDRNYNTHNLIFVGVMSNELNPEGALWFVKNILPKIELKVPDVQFFIVGKDPVKELRELDICNVHVTGFVDDLSQYYRTACAVVIPVLHGGGVKLKLLEAIGYGSVVISTSVGVKGTVFKHNRDILITDDANKFADYCIDVLTNIDKYAAMRQNAICIFKENYTWKGIGKKYSNFLSKLCNN